MGLVLNRFFKLSNKQVFSEKLKTYFEHVTKRFTFVREL